MKHSDRKELLEIILEAMKLSAGIITREYVKDYDTDGYNGLLKKIKTKFPDETKDLEELSI